MGWPNGESETFSEFEIDKIKICEGLYKSQDGESLFFVNSFPEGSELCHLSDPHKGEGKAIPSPLFYHVFLDEDAKQAKEAIEEFLEKGYDKKDGSIFLYRKGSKSFFRYRNGEINPLLLARQEDLGILLSEELAKKDAYIVPLTFFLFPCPVCGKKTIEERWSFEICPECGWEDDCCVENEDHFSCVNGVSIKEARRNYLRAKRIDPSYTRDTYGRKPGWFLYDVKRQNNPDSIKPVDERKELRLTREKAIEWAISCGQVFLEDFHSCYDFHGDGSLLEMQLLYENFQNLALESNGEKLSRTEINDWFLTAGSSPKDYLEDEEEVKAYDVFCNYLLLENDVRKAMVKSGVLDDKQS